MQCLPPTEILEGGVKIIQNKYLSYAPQVIWQDIVKDGAAPIILEDNGPESEWRVLPNTIICCLPVEDVCHDGKKKSNDVLMSTERFVPQFQIKWLTLPEGEVILQGNAVAWKKPKTIKRAKLTLATVSTKSQHTLVLLWYKKWDQDKTFQNWTAELYLALIRGPLITPLL